MRPSCRVSPTEPGTLNKKINDYPITHWPLYVSCHRVNVNSIVGYVGHYFAQMRRALIKTKTLRHDYSL
jgi:hypothetical protein